MKQTYWLWICDACGEQHQYAGFCDFCPSPQRLSQVRAVPVPIIQGYGWERGGRVQDFASFLSSLPGEPLPQRQT